MQRMIRFVIVGLSNTVISFCVFQLLVSLLSSKTSWAAALSQALAYAAGVAWSFTWNRKWTFTSENRYHQELFRFLLLQIALLFLSATSIQALVVTMHISPSLAWVMVMIITTGANFIGCRDWVFNETTIQQ